MLDNNNKYPKFTCFGFVVRFKLWKKTKENYRPYMQTNGKYTVNNVPDPNKISLHYKQVRHLQSTTNILYFLYLKNYRVSF